MINLLKENVDSTLFLFPKSQQYLFQSVIESNRNKNKINKWDLIMLRSFCTAKEIINKMKRQPTDV